MISVQSKTKVEGVTGLQLTDFLLYCSDEEYQRSWPGTHLHLRTLRRRLGGVGNVVYIDERIGNVRLRATGVVAEAVPGRRIVWQLRVLVRLPVRLVLEFQDDPNGVHITHTISAGLPGLSRVVDPLLRRYVSPTFVCDMHEHVRIEFARLGERLRESASARCG
jgi:hypothetical protein